MGVLNKDEVREFTIKFIEGAKYSFFDFEDLRNAFIIYINRDKDVNEYMYNPDFIETINEVVWDLVMERKINPVPYGTGKSGSTKFFIKK